MDGAIAHRERAYAALRKRGDAGPASLIAMWISREYAEAVGNEPASRGWLARAEGLVSGLSEDAGERGLMSLARGRRTVRERAPAVPEPVRVGW